jgi:hypothetical protein
MTSQEEQTPSPEDQTPRAKPVSPTSKKNLIRIKQEKLIDEVVQRGAASSDAGDSRRRARVHGARILRRMDVNAQIKCRVNAAKVDPDEIIGTLVRHMRADIGDLLADDGSLDLPRAIANGSTDIIKKITICKRHVVATTGGNSTLGEVASRVRGASTLTDGSRDLGSIEETTYKFVLHDSQSAARQLARIFHFSELRQILEHNEDDQPVEHESWMRDWETYGGLPLMLNVTQMAAMSQEERDAYFDARQRWDKSFPGWRYN